MKTMLTTAAMAATLSLAVSHVAVAQDRETHATRLFDVSEEMQRSGPCGDLPFLWLTNTNMITFLDALLSGVYDGAGQKLPEYISCFEDQRAVVNLRMVIHAEFPGTEAAFKVAEEGYFTEADIDEFIWLLKGSVKPAATKGSKVDSPDVTATRQIRPGSRANGAGDTHIGGTQETAIGTGEQVAVVNKSDSTWIPHHKPPTPSRPNAEAVATLLVASEKEMQELATPVPNGATAPWMSPRQQRSPSGSTPKAQQQLPKASALAVRAQRVREGRGSSILEAQRKSFAPPSPANRRAKMFEPVAVSQVKAIRLHFQGCWVPPEGLRDLVVKIRFGLLPDGSLRTEPTIVEQSRTRSRDFRAAAEAAQRAVQECTPLDELPEANYEQWREIELAFDPTDLPR